MAPAPPRPSGLPHLSVEDVWREALPEGTEVVAGRTGLQREAVWCSSLKARAPAFEQLRGGELVLVDISLLILVDPRLTLVRLLDSLAAQGVAAVGVLGADSPQARERADRLGLPLLVLPKGGGLDEVADRVLRFMVERRAELHERAQDLHRQLSELAFAGRGLEAVLRRLTELVEAPVVLERGASVEYVAAGRDRALPDAIAQAIAAERPELEAWLREVPLSASDPPVIARALPGGMTRLIAPILVQGTIAGFLSLLGSDGELSELHRLAVGRAASACAIELVRAHAARDARDELEEEVLDVLAGGRPGSLEAATERARRKGVDLQNPYVVYAAGCAAPGRAAVVRVSWERSLAGRRLPALVRERGDTVVALVALGRRAGDPAGLAQDLQRAAQGPAGAAVAVGHGRARTLPAEVGAAVREAEQALSLGRRLFGADAVVPFRNLGLYRLLAGLNASAELREYHTEMLGELKRRDRAGVLQQTLRAYLACNGSPTDAADRLHLHRNTVLYRLGRIQEIAGVDLRDAEVRLNLHLALKIEDVLATGLAAIPVDRSGQAEGPEPDARR
jgi:purine catabolism regulator